MIGSVCVILQNFVAIVQNVPDIWRFFYIFNMATVRHLGFVISMFVWTTHEQYLVVFIAVQNLVGIRAVFSIICNY